MPTYTYKVKDTDFIFEYKQSIKDDALKFLPSDIEGYDENNPKEVERVLTSNVNFIFQGSGFYQTDYKNTSSKPTSTEKSTTPTSNASSTS
jgi:predicted nucleic acid-binding Zn ribbon protein